METCSSPYAGEPSRSCGTGFPGLGNDHYPPPWQSLKYDTRLGGYLTGITEQQLQAAPKYSDDSEWNWNDAAQNRALNAYYGVPVG